MNGADGAMVGRKLMATLDQANEACREHADALANLGAYAVGVEPGKAHGHKGHVVIAYVDPKRSPSLPESLEVGSTGVKVPLVVEKAERIRQQDYD